MLRGLGQAILAVLDEASAWLGETIPASVRDGVPALRRALDKFKIRQEHNAVRPDEDQGGPEMEM